MALSGKFAQNSGVNYLTDVIQPVLTIDGVRRPLGKYIPTMRTQNTTACGL